MKYNPGGRRRAFIFAACVATMSHGLLHAQGYPTSPVTIVVPYGPGSYTDNVIRPLAAVLQKALGQPVVIDNRAGAGGIIGTQYAADFPARDLKSFLAHAASQIEALAVGYGSSSAQVALALLSKESGAKFIGVPYKGTPQAITDLIGGQVPVAIVDVANGVPQMRSGKLHALAISGAARSASAPDVPTLAETWPGTQLVTWVGLVAPAGTPAAIVQRLSTAVGAAVESPELRQKFATIATEADPASAQELGQRMTRDFGLWLDLMKAAGIQPE